MVNSVCLSRWCDLQRSPSSTKVSIWICFQYYPYMIWQMKNKQHPPGETSHVSTVAVWKHMRDTHSLPHTLSHSLPLSRKIPNSHVVGSRGCLTHFIFRCTSLYLHATQSMFVLLSLVHSFCQLNWPPHLPIYQFLICFCWVLRSKNLRSSALTDNLSCLRFSLNLIANTADAISISMGQKKSL